jgi:hypothetical protein
MNNPVYSLNTSAKRTKLDLEGQYNFVTVWDPIAYSLTECSSTMVLA